MEQKTENEYTITSSLSETYPLEFKNQKKKNAGCKPVTPMSSITYVH